MAVAREFFRLPAEEKAKLYSDDPARKIRLSTSFNVRKETVARLPPAALPPPRPVRARLAVQPARHQGDHEPLLQGGPGAGVQAVRGNLGEPGPGGELHGGGAGGAGAAHGRQLLPAVPGAGAHLRAPRPHRPQRAHHPAHGPGRRRPAGAPRRPLGRRQPAPRRAHRQHRRPAAGAQRRGVPQRVANKVDFSAVCCCRRLQEDRKRSFGYNRPNSDKAILEVKKRSVGIPRMCTSFAMCGYQIYVLSRTNFKNMTHHSVLSFFQLLLSYRI